MTEETIAFITLIEEKQKSFDDINTVLRYEVEKADKIRESREETETYVAKIPIYVSHLKAFIKKMEPCFLKTHLLNLANNIDKEAYKAIRAIEKQNNIDKGKELI
jgi:hypothetical protein